MNESQISNINERLITLGKFTENRSSYKESEIIDWIAECTKVFTETGVDSVIISSFLQHFRSGWERITIDQPWGNKSEELVKIIGPFREEVPEGLSRFRTGNYVLSGSFYYAKIAFSAARSAVKSRIDEKRIVPFWLIETLSGKKELKHISASLELLQLKYEKQDISGIMSEAVTLLDSVLNLDKDLKAKRDLGPKLNSLMENGDKLKLFGVDVNIVRGLNSGRIIRNEKISHKKKSLKYDIPFMVSVCFAYLVIFFVECAIANGNILEF